MTSTLRKRAGAALMTGGWLLTLSAGLAVAADDRTPDQIIKDIESVAMPTIDRAKINDRDAVNQFLQERQKAAQRRAELILELYKAAPDHERLVQLLPERWMALPPVGPQADEVMKEISDVIAKTKSEKLKLEAALAKVRISYYKDPEHPEGMLPAVDEFLKIAPQDPRGSQLLYMVASQVSDPAKKNALEDRILKEYPQSPVVSQIKAARRQREAIGKPFELEFSDAIKNTTISMKELKGKVVVIDFWATWCGPCVAEMPKMKDLYAKYKDQGVEFIGVSLDQPEDQGGLQKLKDFVHERGISWPQYYQGKGWQSEFSSSWGVNAIPCVFVVDTEGKLYSTEARGKLEELIPELLKKAKPADAGGGK